MKVYLSAVIVSLVLVTACTAQATTQPANTPIAALPATELASGTGEPAPSFALSSPAFGQGGPIPSKYSCNGDDISPPLAWGEPPAGTKSLALIVDDPDAPGGTWVHWVVFNIPLEFHELAEGMQGADAAVTVGENSWGRSDYGGPCPPSGTHRYFFKLYALDAALDLDKSAGKKQVLAAMEGHVLAEADLMGTFSH